MLTRALKPTDIRFVSFLIMIFLLVGTANARASAPKKKKSGTPLQAQKVRTPVPETVPIKEWGPYLDAACELTYWDKSEIRDWREKQEKEIGEPLAEYIAAWNKRLSDHLADADATRDDEQLPVYQEKDFLRLAIAQTVDYLQGENRDSLNGAARTLLTLKNKGSMPVIAFWTGFVAALQAIENNDSEQFVARVFDIWNNSVMYMEQGTTAGKGTAAANAGSAPFYYRNIVYLVANRAIIGRKMADVNALGPIFLMLNERDMAEKEYEGKYLTTLVRRIAEGIMAPDSDRCRLNYTVAIIEAKRLHQIAAAKLDAEGMSAEARKFFEQSRIFNDLAYKWAASPRSSGAVTAVVDYLDLSSLAIERLAGNQNAPEYEFFAMIPTHDGLSTLFNSMAVFNDLATYTDGKWSKAGYANRELYLKATHRLWRAIMELSLWTGDFYLMKINDSADRQNIFNLATPMQTVLNTYLDFLNSQKRRGFPDVIPDSAYFGAAEAAEKLAYCYLKTCAYSTDGSAYNLWFIHQLQATEMFPFDPGKIARTAAILRRDGRYNLFLDYFLPLANRFRQSESVKSWLEDQKSDSAKAIRNYISSINEVFTTASADSFSFSPPLRRLREDLQRNPDHPVHKLLKDFYVEEMQKSTSFTLLLRDPNRLNRGF